jgi:hypothetical protein
MPSPVPPLDAHAVTGVVVLAHPAPAQSPGTTRQLAVRATRAAAAPAARAVPAATLAADNNAAIVKHLAGEDVGVLEGWASPFALATDTFLFGARISQATGRIELKAPSATFLPRLRAGLNASSRLLLDVGGRGAWLANQMHFGNSALFVLGLGEAFSTVARLEHKTAPRAAEDGETSAATDSFGDAITNDYLCNSRVLVLWLDPACVIVDQSVGTAPVVGPVPFELTHSGGGGPVPLVHGTALVVAVGGSTIPPYTVRPSPSSHRNHGDCHTLTELRFYISAAVARRCVFAGEGIVRREAADSVQALLLP